MRWLQITFVLAWAVFGWKETRYHCAPGIACPPPEVTPAFQDGDLHFSWQYCVMRAQDKHAVVNGSGGWNQDLPETATQPARQIRWHFACRELPTPPPEEHR
jgi:hypothetical protein